jgi:hypothetical protein
LPNAQRVELVGCGHLPAYTHPEPLAALVCDFRSHRLLPRSPRNVTLREKPMTTERRFLIRVPFSICSKPSAARR